MLRYFLFLAIILLATSCKENNNLTKKTSKTKFFGDSLKIVYTYSGDTVFQKRTYFNNNIPNKPATHFNVKSIWTTIEPFKLDCEHKIKFNKNMLDYTFCFKDVLSQTKKQFKKSTELKWHKEDIRFLKEELIAIQKGELDSVSVVNYYMLFHFVKNLDFVVFDNKTKQNVSKIRMEKYESNYSEGHIYYLINKNLDTVAKFNLNDWMK